MTKVSEINIYPIKSIGSISKNKISVEKKGFSDDRCFMLVDNNNQFITQRKHPSLALISVIEQENSFLFRAANKSDLVIPKTSSISDVKLIKKADKKKIVTIWRDSCSSYSTDKLINLWFCDYLGFKVSLVAYDNLNPRQADPMFSNENDIVSFADGFPILVISQASLDDLNSRLINPVTMQRFRPNIVVEGCDAFDEDQWRNITIGNVNFEAVKLCSRCILTTVDPKTGIKNKNGEPLKTLSQYRKDLNGVSNEKGVFFGMNLIPKNLGNICVGDSVINQGR